MGILIEINTDKKEYFTYFLFKYISIWEEKNISHIKTNASYISISQLHSFYWFYWARGRILSSNISLNLFNVPSCIGKAMSEIRPVNMSTTFYSLRVRLTMQCNIFTTENKPNTCLWSSEKVYVLRYPLTLRI